MSGAKKAAVRVVGAVRITFWCGLSYIRIDYPPNFFASSVRPWADLRTLADDYVTRYNGAGRLPAITYYEIREVL